MAYSAISQSEMNPDSEIVDTVFSRGRDNWVAIKDGESGAPRIQTQALHPPTSGYNWAWQFFGTVNTAPGVWTGLGPLSIGVGASSLTAGGQIWRTGTYHFWMSVDRTNTTEAASVAIYRNGVRHSAIYTCPAGTAYQLFTFGLQFNAGDLWTAWATSNSTATIGVLGAMTDKPFAYIG